LLTICVGIALSVVGASFQRGFSNPLMSPDILGVSSGAGFGAALGLLMEKFLLVQSSPIIFGLLSIVMVFILSMTRGKHSTLMLILASVVVGQFFQALISFVEYVADPETKLPTITFWLMGSLGHGVLSGPSNMRDRRRGVHVLSASARVAHKHILDQRGGG
jgi:iron complex transport system permease protein